MYRNNTQLHTKMKTAGLPLLFSALILTIAMHPDRVAAQDSDHDAIVETLTTFFDGFAEGDSTKMYSQVESGGRLVLTFNDADGNPGMRAIGMSEFVRMISGPREQPIKETFWNPEIRVEDNLASAWVEYNLWVGDTIDHCGTDNFQLFRSSDGWKIVAIADTQQRTGCTAHY